MMQTGEKRRLIVGISGASGVVMGYWLLRALKQAEKVETHLILTEGARKTLALGNGPFPGGNLCLGRLPLQ